MLAIFSSTPEQRDYCVVDSNGNYHGVYPNLSTARKALKKITESKDAPEVASIHQTKLIDQVERSTHLQLADYKFSV